MDMQICWCIYKKWKWSKYIKSWFAGKCKLFFPFDFWYFYDASRMLLKQSSINVNTLNRLYGFLLSSMCLLDYVLGLERWRIKWQDQQGTQRQPANGFWKAAHWTRQGQRQTVGCPLWARGGRQLYPRVSQFLGGQVGHEALESFTASGESSCQLLAFPIHGVLHLTSGGAYLSLWRVEGVPEGYQKRA